MKFASIIFASAFLIACGGGSSSSSSSEKKDESQSSGQQQAVSECQVQNDTIELAEGASCTISAETKSKYSLFISGNISCSNGKIVTSGATFSNGASLNGVTLNCK